MTASLVPVVWPKAIVSERYLAFLLGVPIETLERFAEEAGALYAPFTKVQQRNGVKKERRIDNPKERLKCVQRRIKARILDQVTLPKTLAGGVPGRCTKHNAKPHVRRAVVVTMDFESFFPRITNNQVAAMWRSRFGASSKVAWLLTRLTTFEGHLPQGSPASNGVANLVLLPFIAEVAKLCDSHGCGVTVYVDDVTVSGRHSDDLIDQIARIASRHGFKLARKKTRVMREHERQSVTGHVVNRKISSGHVRVRSIRRRVLDVLVGRRDVAELSSIRGSIAHVRATCPRQGIGLRRLLEVVERQEASQASR